MWIWVKPHIRNGKLVKGYWRKKHTTPTKKIKGKIYRTKRKMGIRKRFGFWNILSIFKNGW